MVIPKGYKQTEVGVIPEDWEICSIDSLMNIETGSKNTENKTDDGRYPFFVRSKKIEHIDTYTYDCEAVLTAGDGVGTGKVFHYYNGKFDVHQRVYVMSNFRMIDAKYFYSYFSKNFGREVKKYTAKSSVDSVRREMIAKMVIPLPSLVEQKRISKFLSDGDNLIGALEKLIEKKKAIKQGAMQELLTGKKRLPGFTGNWKMKKLGEISNIKTGDKNNEQKSSNGKYPFFVRSQKVERIDTYSFDGEAILIPGEGNIGEIFHYINGKFDYHQRVYKISNFPKNISGKYIFYQMKYSFGKYALKNTVKATVDSLRLSTFINYSMSFPPTYFEQKAIANILSDMDNEINALEKKLEKYRQIKQGMMEQLLSGKIRLVVTESAQVPEKLKLKGSGHNHQFDDAVTIAAIVNAFYSDRFPLGRKKVQKLLYLLRRKQESAVTEFKKKAAGPYADEIRYKGGEPIAKKNGYISVKSSKKGSVFSRGEKISDALEYVNKWELNDDINWLISNFRYTKTNILELLATIDMAICDLKTDELSISLQNIKNLIRSNKEWKAKLDKTYFSDRDIIWAMNECKRLFG